MTRPRRFLSRGIRIYNHYSDGVRTRTSFNVEAGMKIVTAASLIWGVTAVGCESGAMTIHLMYPFAYRRA